MTVERVVVPHGVRRGEMAYGNACLNLVNGEARLMSSYPFACGWSPAVDEGRVGVVEPRFHRSLSMWRPIRRLPVHLRAPHDVDVRSREVNLSLLEREPQVRQGKEVFAIVVALSLCAGCKESKAATRAAAVRYLVYAIIRH